MRILVWTAALLVLGVAASRIGLVGADEVGASSATAPTAEPAGDSPQSIDSTSGPSVIRFQRVYVPAERVDDWPLGGNRYLPLDKADFERLLKQADAPVIPASPRIVQATYRASLGDDGLLMGSTLLQIDAPENLATLLSLGRGHMALEKARWQDPKKTTTLGLGPRGDLNVLVEGSGRLQFDWRLARSRETNETRQFDLDLPPSTATTLTLEVPDDVTPTCDRGICVGTKANDEDRKIWRFELGGQRKATLRLARAEAVLRADRQPEVYESLVYNVSAEGIQLETSLQIEAATRPHREVRLRLDPGLKLVTARYGQTPVSWSTTSNPGEQSTQVIVELPESSKATARVLHLGALCPLVLDRPWRLPRIRPQDMFWREGNATLLVPFPLRIEHIKEIDCRQSRLGPLPAPGEGESTEFQYYSPDSTVELVVSRRRTPVEVDYGASIELDTTEATGKLIARFKARKGEVFELEARLKRPWIVDTVTSDPPGLVRDWRLDPDAQHGNRLVIRLSKALSPARGAVKIEIAGRRLQSPLKDALTADDLTPVCFPSADTHNRFLAVRTRAPYELVIRGDQRLGRISPEDLDAETRELLPAARQRLVFSHDSRADNLRIALRKRPPGYTGDIHVEASVSAETMRESYRFRCTPQSSHVDHLLIHFSHARGVPPQWSCGSEEGQPVPASRLTPAEQTSAGMGPDGETWKISLLPTCDQPFEIRATRTVNLPRRMAISLAALPEANSQTATLVVRAAEATPLRIDAGRLQRIPTEPAPSGQYQTARATFHYEPEPLALSPAVDAVTVSIDTKADSGQSAFAWDCRIDSRYEGRGGSQHLVTYRLENTGRPSLRVTLPSSSKEKQIREVWIDGQCASWRLEEAPSGQKRLAIDLPSAKRFPVVGIDFSVDSPALGFVDTLEPPRLKPDVPVLATRWIAWLPASHRCLSTDVGCQPYPENHLNWRRRLFGPLGRAAQVSPFDPLSAADWANLYPLGTREPTQHTVRRLLAALGTLPEVNGPDGPPGEMTLGEILRGKPVRESGLTVLVDQPALAGAGVSATTKVPTRAASTPLGRGMALLREADLSALALHDVVLITTSLQASLLQDHLEPTGNSRVWRVLPGPLALDLDNVAGARSRNHWLGVSTWRKQPPPTSEPCTDRHPLTSVSGDTLGWSAHCLELSPSQPARLRIVHRRGIEVMRWVTFLAVVGLGRWKWGNRPVKLILAAALCAALALLLPTFLAVVASGALLGMLFCLCVLLLRFQPGGGSAGGPSSLAAGSSNGRALPDTTQSLRAFVLLVLALGCCGRSLAEEARGEVAPLRVLIPVDQQRKPSGEKVFVPEPLYRQLVRGATAGRSGPGGWLIESASYQGELRWEGIPKRLVPGQMRASLQIRVFDRHARVRVPLSREHLSFPPDWAFLDGRVIRPQWEADGGALGFVAPTEGYHRLEVVFTPSARTSTAGSPPAAPPQDERGFDVRIPRVPRCRLELALPANAPPIEVCSAQGRVALDAQQLSAQLGATDHLSVCWRADAQRGGAHAIVEVDELRWLNITPGSVLLSVRFHFRVLQGRVSEIRLAVDPRLKLLGDVSLGRLETIPGSSTSLRVKLPAARSESFTLDARFSLHDTSGVGRHRLPLVRVEGARIADRLFAVTVDDSLQWTEYAGADGSHEKPPAGGRRPSDESNAAGNNQESLQSIAISDFLTAWGDADSSPCLAYRHRDELPRWSIATRPPSPRTVVDQRLTASFAEKQMLVRYEASVKTTAGYGFRYRLHVPPTLEVDSLAADEEDVDRLARWSRAADGSIDVVLTGPVTARRRLLLEGHMTVPRKGPVELPIPVMADAYLQSLHVTLFRQPPVLLELDRYDGLEEAEPEPLAPDQSPLGRPFVSLIGSGRKKPRLWLRISPNRPKLDVRQTIFMEPRRAGAGKWRARARIEVVPRGGLVDEIRLAIPADLAGEPEIEPSLPMTETVLPDGSRELIIRGTRPVVGLQQWSLSIPLMQERVVVPDIAVRNAHRQERRLVLPRRMNHRRVYWDTQRLEKISSTPEATTYKILGKDFRAALLPSKRPGSTPRVLLAEVNLIWDENGVCHGAAHFDLDGAGRAWCPLLVPKGYRLVQVMVDGVPTTPVPRKADDEPTGSRRLRIPLGPPTLPQRITIVFTGRLLEGVGRACCTLNTPRLGDLPVDKSFWLVAGPRGYELSSQTATLRPLLDVLRADSFCQMVELAAKSNAETSDKLCWSRTWRSRLRCLQSDLKEHLGLGAPLSMTQPVEKRLAALRRQWTALDEQLGKPAPLEPGKSPAPSRDETDQFRRKMLDRPESTVYRAVGGELKPLTLEYRCETLSWANRHLPGILVLGVLFLLGYLAVIHGLWQIVADRWPQALVVAVGLAWWLFLVPSILGLGLVVVGIGLTIRRSRRVAESPVVPAE